MFVRIMVQSHLPAAHARVQIHVVRLRRPHEGQHQQIRIRQPCTAHRRFELQPMQWIARQERRHPPPAAARETRPHFRRRNPQRREFVMRRQLHAAHPPAQIHRVRVVQQPVHARVLRIRRAVNRQRLCQRVGGPLVAHRHHRQQHAFRIAQRDRSTRCDGCRKVGRNVQHHRQRPQCAIGQPHLRQHALVIRTRVVAGERRKGTRQQQLQIAALKLV